MPQSTLKYKALPKVFGYGDLHEHEMQMQLARLCVLYEDLKLETDAAMADALAPVDKCGVDYRRMYFFRRTLNTLHETKRGLDKLSSNKVFKAHKKEWPHQARAEFKEAMKVLNEHHALLTKLRNDLGGHFDEAAALHAVEHLEPDDIASCEIHTPDMTSADVRFWFARSLVGMALTHHSADQTSRGRQEFFDKMFGIMVDVRFQARSAIRTIAMAVIWPRFHPSGV